MTAPGDGGREPGPATGSARVDELEERLQETEGRFRTMADCAPVLLWMAGLDSSCDFFNETWLRFTGRSLGEELGVGWAEGIHPEDFQRCMDVYQAAFSARLEFKMEYRLRRHDGHYRWVLDNGVPRFGQGGSFLGYIGSCVDITDRHVAEQERRVLVARLEEALRTRDQFISIASHELNTPLTALRLTVERLERSGAGGELAGAPAEARRGRLAANARRQVDRLAKLTEEMLDISRIARNELLIERAEVDLGVVAELVVEQLADQLAAKACAVALQVEPGVVGRWDASRLEQLLVNLLGNAMKYGAGRPIQLDVARHGAGAVLRVRDEGRGIAKADHARIFRCFERAVAPDEVSGLGLGLYICDQIARAHGGGIRVESEVGEGATFTVELPRGDAEDPPLPAEAAAPAAG